MATSIRHEAFETKNEALKRCHHSFADLQIQYERGLETSSKISR